MQTTSLEGTALEVSAPGWYPDADGRSPWRYWDGQHWTPYTSASVNYPTDHPAPMPFPQPPVTGRPPRRRFGLKSGLGLVVALVVAGALLLAVTQFRRSSDQPATAVSSGPTSSRNATVSGTEDDWTASVCRTGTCADGVNGLPYATDRAFCYTKTGHAALMISKFDSQVEMKNALAVAGDPYYVSGNEPDGTIILFTIGLNDSPSALQPLTSFGFTVQKAKF